MKQKKFDMYIKNAASSNVAKSCRRFLFNYMEKSIEERGYFHVDGVYGMGTGVLLRYGKFARYGDKFFILTAKHVLDNNLNEDDHNESPFWIPMKSASPDNLYNSLFNFMFPRIRWNIGELMPEVKHVDLSDICLVELFCPQPFAYPDNYIKIIDSSSVLSKTDFFEGQLLLVSGYPFEKNSFFDFTETYTNSTNIHRHTIVGVLRKDKEDEIGYISFEMTKNDIQHENVNGMSGSAIYNVQPKANQVKLAGIAVTAGNNICRFIPSYLLIEAILNYQKASHKVIDPMVNLENL
jgi:hypothetical protein